MKAELGTHNSYRVTRSLETRICTRTRHTDQKLVFFTGWGVEAYTSTEKLGMVTVATVSQPKNQQRTAIVYFGPKWETYLELVEAEDSSEFLRFTQQPLQAQLGVEKHQPNCCAWS